MTVRGSMLTIRDAQLGVFRQARIRGFVDDLVDYLAGEYPVHVERLGVPGVREFVARSMAEAERLRIRTQGSVAAFAELRLIYGDKLERAPDRQWAHNILAHPTLPDYLRVGAVQDRFSERTAGRTMVVHQEPPG